MHARDIMTKTVVSVAPGHDVHRKIDAAIQRSLLAEHESQPRWHADRGRVTVSDGIVRFAGEIESGEEKVPVRVAAEIIAGGRGVEDSRSIAIPAAGYPPVGYL